MECPKCGFQNHDSAMVCAKCEHVLINFKKELEHTKDLRIDELQKLNTRDVKKLSIWSKLFFVLVLSATIYFIYKKNS